MLGRLVLCLCIAYICASPLEKTLLSKGARIVNGQQASSGQFPWQVGLIVRGLHNWFCGGTIISPEWILTSGYCVEGTTTAQVITGQTEYNGIYQTANKFIMHENYDPSTHANDIGLIKLSVPLTFNENVSSIAIDDGFLRPGIEVVMSGWGTVEENKIDRPEILRYVYVNSIGNYECGESWGHENIYDTMVCAKSVGLRKGPCHGDRGVPLVSNFHTRPILVAVNSIWESCTNEIPFLSTRTSAYRGWIQEKTGI